MWIADQWKDYEVLDTSEGEKLERWGDYLLVLEYSEGASGLEKNERPLSQKQQGRWRMGVF